MNRYDHVLVFQLVNQFPFRTKKTEDLRKVVVCKRLVLFAVLYLDYII